jgi:threonine dehydratase
MRTAEEVVTLADVEEAQRRIAKFLPVTPLAGSQRLSTQWKFSVSFKLEMLHTTGSFKERGALNKLLAMSEEERKCGVVAASAGNHAQALAFHARRLNVPAVIVMPENAPLIKVQNTSADGAEVILHGAGYDDALGHARELSHQRGLTFVHGFDDPAIIAGQGTAALEMHAQNPDLDCVIIPVGGGGLLAGMACAYKALNPRIRVIGVQTEAIPSMIKSLEAGEAVTVPYYPTIADGIAVRTPGQLCLSLARIYVDEMVTVSEGEIAQAVLLMLEQEKAAVEGAGAAGVAAILSGRVHGLDGKNIGVVLSGGNIDVNRLARIIDKGLVRDGRLARMRVCVPDRPGELSRILQMVAQLRANILDIHHDRTFSRAQVGETCIDLVLETRGESHITEILAGFESSGLHVIRIAELL